MNNEQQMNKSAHATQGNDDDEADSILQTGNNKDWSVIFE